MPALTENGGEIVLLSVSRTVITPVIRQMELVLDAMTHLFMELIAVFLAMRVVWTVINFLETARVVMLGATGRVVL